MPDILLAQADAAGFVPQTWAYDALSVLRANMPILKTIASDASVGEVGWAGKILNIPYPGKFTAQDKVEGTPVTPQQPAGGAFVPVTLSRHKVVDFLVEDFANAQANRDLRLRYMEPAALAIVEAVSTDVFSLFGSLSAPSVGTLGTGIGAGTIRQARKNLNDNRAPMTNRSIIVGDADEVAILGDSTLQNYFAYNQTAAIQEGMIGRVYGFDIYSSQLAPIYAPVSNGAQTLTISGGPTGGTFTVTFAAQTTAGIPWNATANQVEAALQLLSTLGPGKVKVSGGPMPGVMTFLLAPSITPSAFTCSVAGLTGGAPAQAVANVGATTAANYNLAYHRDAMIFVSRPFRDIPAGYGAVAASMSDQETGMTIRILTGYDMSNRGFRIGMDILYGFRDLRPSLGLAMLS